MHVYERKLKTRVVLVKIQCNVIILKEISIITQKNYPSKMDIMLIAIQNKIKRRGCLDVTEASEFGASETPS